MDSLLGLNDRKRRVLLAFRDGPRTIRDAGGDRDDARALCERGVLRQLDGPELDAFRRGRVDDRRTGRPANVYALTPLGEQLI